MKVEQESTTLPRSASRLRVRLSSPALLFSCSTLSPAKGRRGISLTEVLLSMFVMTVGILGLAALIPVGGSDVATAVRNDRTSNLGRAAFRDVQVRDWLNPNMWLNHRARNSNDGAHTPPQPWLDVDVPDTTSMANPRPAIVLQNSPLDLANAFCIDPLFVARNATTTDPNDRRGRFPYPLDNDPDSDATFNTLPNPPRMLRGTLMARPMLPSETFPTAIGAAQADRLFRSTDDLVFGLPDNEPDGRPFASLGSARQVRQFTGDYSWLLTVAPLMNDSTMTSNTTGAPQSYTVSVVVFQKRTLELSPELIATSGVNPGRDGTLPTERTVYADFISGVGLGGGDVRLGLPIRTGDPNNDANQPKQSDFPAVKPGQWIMLSGWSHVGGGFRSPTFRWYRVVTAGPLKQEATTEFPAGISAATSRSNRPEWAQYVTLAGPDWWSAAAGSSFVDVDNPPNLGASNGTPHTVHAAIIDGVVGVYEKTMRLDTRSFGVR